MECMDLHKGWVILENYSVDSDSRDKYGVNEIADQQIVWDHSTRGDFSKRILKNIYSQISADQSNVLICTGGWGIFENSSVESDSRDNYGVNETADQQLVWNH